MNCPKCGSTGYVGLTSFRCDNTGCSNGDPTVRSALAYDAPPAAAPVELRAVKDHYAKIEAFMNSSLRPRYHVPRRLQLANDLMAAGVLHGPEDDAPGAQYEAGHPPDFDPRDWDHCQDAAALQHHNTGQRMSMMEYVRKKVLCSKEVLDEAQDRRHERTQQARLARLKATLRDVAAEVGLDDNGAYPLDEITARVRQLKDAVASIKFYTVDGTSLAVPRDTYGTPVKPAWLK